MPAHFVVKQRRVRHVTQFMADGSHIGRAQDLMVPRVGWTSPARTRSKLVFPAPLSPRIVYSRPGTNSALTPRSAAKRPNCLTRALTVTKEKSAFPGR